MDVVCLWSRMMNVPKVQEANLAKAAEVPGPQILVNSGMPPVHISMAV